MQRLRCLKTIRRIVPIQHTLNGKNSLPIQIWRPLLIRRCETIRSSISFCKILTSHRTKYGLEKDSTYRSLIYKVERELKRLASTHDLGQLSRRTISHPDKHFPNRCRIIWLQQ